MTHKLLIGSTPATRGEKIRRDKDNYYRPDYHLPKEKVWTRTESNDKAARMALDECMRVIKG